MSKINKILNNIQIDEGLSTLTTVNVFDILSSVVLKDKIKKTDNLSNDKFIQEIRQLLLDIRKVVLGDLSGMELKDILDKYE